MATPIQSIRGMNDVLPNQASYWSHLESVLSQIADSYGYMQIRLPILEETSLFKRTVGEATDIVEKEMYTFTDRKGESISLRPEGTAGCVRAGIQHGLFYNQLARLWYLGPMFRYERPQQGRFRQFYHFGVEAFGMPGPDIDIEQLLMMARIWDYLGLKDQVRLHINSLGSSAAREKYREKLVEFFNENIDILDEDSKRRLATNPLRILDSKNPAMQLMLSAAPRMLDYLDELSKTSFTRICNQLEKANIPYVVDSRIVRGLDYYNMTVYEWVTDYLGAQGTVCAGGRYDKLVEHLGGKPTPAVGFAIGLERVIALLATVYTPEINPHIYIIMVGAQATECGRMLAEKIHASLPEVRVLSDYSDASIKSQFRRADKSGAKIAIVLGQNEVEAHTVTVKYLRQEYPQCTVPQDGLEAYLLKALVE